MKGNEMKDNVMATENLKVVFHMPTFLSLATSSLVLHPYI